MLLLQKDMFSIFVKCLGAIDLEMLGVSRRTPKLFITKINIAYYAAKYGSLKWLLRARRFNTIDANIYATAARYGHLNIVKLAPKTDQLIREAIAGKHKEVIEFLTDTLNGKLFKLALISGYIDISVPTSNSIRVREVGIVKDDVEMLMRARKLCKPTCDDYLDTLAAEHGAVKCYAKLTTCYYDRIAACVRSLENGYTNILEYEVRMCGGIPEDEDIIRRLYKAATIGGLNCFIYVHTQFRLIIDCVCENVVKYGCFNTLKYLCSQIKHPRNMISSCAKHGNLNYLKIIHNSLLERSMSVNWKSGDILAAIENCHVRVALYMYKNGCKEPSDKELISAICKSCQAKYLSIFMDKLVNIQNFPYKICIEAARMNNLDIVKKIYKKYPNEVLWNTDTCIAAVNHNNSELIRYICKKGSHPCAPICWDEVYNYSLQAENRDICRLLKRYKYISKLARVIGHLELYSQASLERDMCEFFIQHSIINPRAAMKTLLEDIRACYLANEQSYCTSG